MKNLNDIIDECKDNKEPSYEELKYATLALSALLFFDHNDLKKIDNDIPEVILNLKKKHSAERYHVALNMSPRKWIGWGDDPINPKYQEFRETGKKILDKVLQKVSHKDYK